ncbi:Hypothetical protein CINCED_3A017657 [Cinara cedri]|uniref:Uncharacterized protein n=1 Tax=Cinara cedri TaxID=506608 RepID=A0A5E4M9Z7_9HEMI|nr:Hypothetical protein CINCED_3A017657 [Cinara cedri]
MLKASSHLHFSNSFSGTPKVVFSTECNERMQQVIFWALLLKSKLKSDLFKAKNPIPKLINAPVNWETWETFRKNLDENLNNQKRYRDLDDINKSIEHIKGTIKVAENTKLEEYGRELETAVKRRLNQLNRRVKWELDNLRYNSYRAYLEKVNPNDSSLWLATKRILKQPNLIPPLKNEIAKYDTNYEKSEAFSEYFETCFTSEDNTTPKRGSSDESPNATNNKHSNTIIPTSPKEIQLIISKLKSKKSPGHSS